MPRQLNHFLLIISSIFFFSTSVLGQTPTAQQIEQFKRLPRAQQEQLARQLGYDLSALSGFQQGAETQDSQDPTSGPYPRGTRFDEFGNPVYDEQDQALEEEDETLRLYGTALFASSPSTFSPVDDVPVPANYLIGPGDELRVQLYGKENEDFLLVVNRDGSVVIPKLGPVSVASMTFSEAKGFLSDKIRKQMIGVEVSVTMGALRTMRVFVMGEAHKPGAYNVSSLSTITHALFVSGGVTDIASLRNIQLKRSGNLVTTLDLYDLLNKGDSRNDAQLQSGDVVFIPSVQKTVTVDGEVRRPAIYELKDEKTLEQVIALAGGKLPGGYTDAVGVQRYIKGAQVQLTANLSAENPPVMNGDIVTIPKISPVVADSVMLIGAVARPGTYQWSQGMMLSDLVGDIRKNLLDDADLSYALIVRDKNINRDITVVQTDLTQLGQAGFNVELQRNDRVLIFSRQESVSFGDTELADLAFSQETLEENEKEAWQGFIEERLFWNSLGVKDGTEQDLLADGEEDQTSSTVIQLTEDEIALTTTLKNTTFYSRKRLLMPVIARLQEQARYGDPIQLIEVAGEVKVPGVYPLPENASLMNAIKAAGGLTESSYPLKSEVTRTSIDGRGNASIEHIAFSPSDVLAGDESGVALRSRDRVNVFAVPSWQNELKVSVVGEVEFPGEYTIKRGEKLSDLMQRVGGVTVFGEASAAVFTRETLREQERENLRKLAEDLRKQIASESLRRNTGAGSIVSYDEARKLLRDLTKAQAVGRLVIDLERLIEGDQAVDIALNDGDTLYIPGKSQSVNVIGEVYVPTSHLFTEGQSYDDYILKSGGYRALADAENTYIIRANGAVEVPGSSSSFWYSDDKTASVIQPGDTIVVPFDADNVDNMTLWTNATQILYQLAVAIAAIGSL